MNNFAGIAVIVNPNIPMVPKFQIDPTLPMTDEGRRKAQQWCNDFFGMEHRVFMIGHDKALMHPELYAKFCAVVKL